MEPVESENWISLKDDFPKEERNVVNVVIPEMSMWLAVGLLILNIVLPGIGTTIAGVSVLYFGNVGYQQIERCRICILNIGIGILQLLLSVIVIGWVWSIIWGALFILVADDTTQKQFRKPKSTSPFKFVSPVVTDQKSDQSKSGSQIKDLSANRYDAAGKYGSGANKYYDLPEAKNSGFTIDPRLLPSNAHSGAVESSYGDVSEASTQPMHLSNPYENLSHYAKAAELAEHDSKQPKYEYSEEDGEDVAVINV